MEGLISVIVPVYKVEPYLDQCVSSIVNQTYKNLEIILVDDGSPDGCPARAFGHSPVSLDKTAYIFVNDVFKTTARADIAAPQGGKARIA